MRELARTTFSASRNSGAVFVTCDLPLFKLPERFQGSYPPGLSDANPRLFDAPTDRGRSIYLTRVQSRWQVRSAIAGQKCLGHFRLAFIRSGFQQIYCKQTAENKQSRQPIRRRGRVERDNEGCTPENNCKKIQHQNCPTMAQSQVSQSMRRVILARRSEGKKAPACP